MIRRKSRFAKSAKRQHNKTVQTAWFFRISSFTFRSSADHKTTPWHGKNTGKYSDLLSAENGSHTPSQGKTPSVTDFTSCMLKLCQKNRHSWQNTATALLRIRTWFLVRLNSFKIMYRKALLLHLYFDKYSYSGYFITLVFPCQGFFCEFGPILYKYVVFTEKARQLHFRMH